jgi:hypothetical protein
MTPDARVEMNRVTKDDPTDDSMLLPDFTGFPRLSEIKEYMLADILDLYSKTHESLRRSAVSVNIPINISIQIGIGRRRKGN